MDNYLDKIIAYEEGELSDEETVQLFQYLKDSGTIRGLQGHYYRFLEYLMELKLVT